MCSELGLCLAKPRCQEEQDEYLNKWNELSTLDIDLSLFRYNNSTFNKFDTYNNYFNYLWIISQSIVS